MSGRLAVIPDIHGNHRGLLAVPRNQPIALDLTDRYIICAGAVGYSRETVQKPQYCIYDSARQTIEFRTVDGPLEDPRRSYLLAS